MNRSVTDRPPENRFTWPWLFLTVAVVTVIYLLACRDILFAPGHIYQNWDQTFPPYPDEVREYGSIPATIWNHVYELGSPGPMTGISYYFDLFVRRGLAFFGGSFLARWLNLAYVLVGSTGLCLLARRLSLSMLATLVISVVALFNPKTYSVVLSGHTDAFFAYAIAPWMLFIADAALNCRERRRFLALATGCGMVTALACASVFGIVQIAPVLILYAVAACLRHFWRTAAFVIITVAVVLVLHLHWILPTVLGAGGGSLKYNQTASDVQTEYVHKYREYSTPPRNAMIGHTDNLGMGTEYAYPVEPPKDGWWKPSAYALLALALLGLLCPMPDPRLKWFATASLLFGFLALTGSKTLAGAYFYEIILARVKMLFFFMARPTRWLLVYYTGLAILAGLGLEAVRRRTFWTGRRWPDALAGVLTLCVLTVYTWPWWSGQLTTPKNETTQTMALMPQPLLPEEAQLAAALAKDPGLYRITVFPTISSPTGNIPEPPASSLTRNFGMMGKDSLVGPAFIGNPYGRFLLSLAHRRALSTDQYGRLLGLGAVKRVIWDKDQPYLSYLDFGWMPSTKRGSETLPDPRGILKPFLESQWDLKPDAAWTYGSFATLDNKDYLPRVRLVAKASLATGGFPLLESLSQTETPPFDHEAMFFSTDLSPKDIAQLGGYTSGLRICNDSWPELLLPYVPVGRWLFPSSAGKSTGNGWTRISEHWHRVLWFEGSPLNSGALLSQAAGETSIPLTGAGKHRIFIRAAILPGQHGLDIILNDTVLARLPSFDPYDRGWRWLDLGERDIAPGQSLVIRARGRGAVISGALVVPLDEYTNALNSLEQDFPAPSTGTMVLTEAEACVEKARGAYSSVRDVPLLANLPGTAMRSEGLRLENWDGSGIGTLVAEGDHEGEALFRLDFPQAVSGFTLVSYPRLFGDPSGNAFVRAQWSRDGKDFLPLYEVHGATDNKWEDVYGRRLESGVQEELHSLWIRFTLRQAQLGSLGNTPNQPMTVSVSPAQAFPGAPSMGQAVLLPATFAPRVFRQAPHRVRARMLTAQGPQWLTLGTASPDAAGIIRLNIDGPAGAACDLIELSCGPGGTQGTAQPVIETRRINPARYEIEGHWAAGGLLLFSESFHPSWQASWAGFTQTPLKSYGFMNAYMLPDATSGKLTLAFTPERYREIGLRISIAGWVVFALAVCLLLAWSRRGAAR